MPLKINGSTSGSVTLAAPATGSDVTLTLPGSTMDLSSELAAKVNGSAASTAPGSPVTGQVFIDTDDFSLKVWNGSAWVNPSNAGGFLTAADVSATTGSPTTGNYTDSGIGWTYYQWTGNGSVTLAKSGLVDVLVCGGGQNGQSGYSWPDARAAGSSGILRLGAYVIPSGTHTITVGTTANRPSVPGSSSIGSVIVAQGGVAATSAAGGGSNNYGLASAITGTNLEYAYINGASDPAVTDSGYGRGGAINSTTGATAGVVIIRVRT